MDEPLTSTLGFFGLTGLLSSCIEYFDLVEAADQSSVDHETIFRKFQVQRVRLVTWGMATDIIEAHDFDEFLEESYIYSTAQGLLNIIVLLFENDDDLVLKYGLSEINSEVESSESQSTLEEIFERFRQSLRQDQSQTSSAVNTTWAILDWNKFRLFVEDITDAIDAIQNLTKSMGALTRQQEILDEQIETARVEGSSEMLEMLLEAASETAIVQSQSNLILELHEDSIEFPAFPALPRFPATRPPKQNNQLAQQAAEIAPPVPDTSPSVGAPSSRDQEQGDSQIQGKTNTLPPLVRQPAIPPEIITEINKTLLDPFSLDPNRDSAVLQSRNERMTELKRANLVQLTETPQDLASTQEPFQSTRRIMSELQKDFISSDCPYISVSLINGNLRDMLGVISGPEDTPYHGGIFFIRIYLFPNYPLEPPVLQFLTKVYHPNIDEQGRLCNFNSIYWTPVMTISRMLISLCGLLSSPVPGEPLRLDVAEQFTRDRDSFNRIAAAYTALYATGEQPSVHPPTEEYSWWDHARVPNPEKQDGDGESALKAVQRAKIRER